MKDDKLAKKLWDTFDETKAKFSPTSKEHVKSKNALIEHYYYLVEHIAGQQAIKLKGIEKDELASYGVDGLYGAIDKYDRSIGTKFATYATPRIRGSMFDEIRRLDRVPRLVRRQAIELGKQRQSLESDLGRSATDAEMAENINMTKEEYMVHLRKSTPVLCGSIYQLNEEEQEMTISDITSKEINPLSALLKTEMANKLLGKGFTKLERNIINLHYYEGMTFKEISSQVNLSESRISQLHADIIRRLGRKMKRNPEYAKEIEAFLEN